MAALREGETSTYDLDLRGVVRVRLLDATADDLATVTRQLGPLRAPLDGEPDIIVRFVDELAVGPLRYVEVGRTAFDADGFLALQGRHGITARTRLPLDDVGQRPVLVCERTVPAVPHLLAIVNLTALGKGVLPLHASAFVIGDRGVLVTGWSKGGKTESLLAAVGAGARYVADEWVYLAPNRQMFGVPEPTRLWAWHFDQRPDLLRARGRRDRWRLHGWRAAHAVVLLLSHDSGHITSTPAGPTEISGRMAASLAEERAQFMTDYRQFRYAFPNRSSAVVESAAEREAELLRTLFDNRPATRVVHPYPCDLSALADEVRSAALVSADPVQAANGAPR